MKKAIIKSMVLGSVATNCILIKNSETKELLIVDPADQAGDISRAVTLLDGQPVGILLTHGHFDHIGAVDDLRDLYDIPVFACREEEDVLEDPGLNLSAAWNESCSTHADRLLDDEEEFTLAGFEIQMLHTPGHTHGSCCYYIPEEGILLSGDTLFAGSVGRMDFPTSSGRAMQASLQRLLSSLPEDTAVYPGHEGTTTIGHEKRYNPFA